MGNRSGATQFFLDTCDPAAVERWAPTGVVAGITTNPVVLAKAGYGSDLGVISTIARIIAPFPVCVQVTATDPETVRAEAEKLAGVADNIVVKVPITTERGASLIDPIKDLAVAGVRVNATGCMTTLQVVHAYRAGAHYASLLYGRIRDSGGDPVAEVRRVREWVDAAETDNEVIVGSIRAVGDLMSVWDAAPHIITTPPEILQRSLDHPYTRTTVQEFVDAARGEGWT